MADYVSWLKKFLQQSFVRGKTSVSWIITIKLQCHVELESLKEKYLWDAKKTSCTR